ncbi:hypothetical protein K456DRAFT_1629358 [Colletotrichum gloeosporioides 23]|nr:hypothetical protein K456DRAFT_1629358 [Colletotrichum gloeosporioides 23]
MLLVDPEILPTRRNIRPLPLGCHVRGTDATNHLRNSTARKKHWIESLPAASAVAPNISMLLDAPTSQPSIPPSTGKILTDDTTTTITRFVSSVSRTKEPEPTSDPRHRLPQGEARSYRGRSPSFTESISLARDPKANRVPSSQPPSGVLRNKRQGRGRKPWQNPSLRSAVVLKDGPASDGTHPLDGGGLGEGYHNHQQLSSCHETKPTPPPPTDFFFFLLFNLLLG